MKDKAIGVFDYGVSGLILVNELNEMLPGENIIYYSEKVEAEDLVKEKAAVTDYAARSIKFLEEKDVKVILSSNSEVNTVYGIKSPDTVTDYSGIFLPASQAACVSARNNRIGVIGSSDIIKRGGYARIIKNIKPGVIVTGISCSYLTGLEKSDPSPDREKLLDETLKNIKSLSDEKTDTIILADSAYLLIRDELREKLPAVTTLIFPNEEAAKYVYSNLMCSDSLSEREKAENNKVFCADNNTLTDDKCAKFVKRKSELITI